MDAVCNLLDTVKDETPVFDSNGESKGQALVYSITPKIFDENGEPLNLILFDSIDNLVG